MEYYDEVEEIVPEINTAKELKEKIAPLYIINDYMSSEEKYRDFINKIYILIKGCFEKEDPEFKLVKLRDYPIKFKFYKTDKKTYELSIRMFLLNLFCWFPFVKLYGIDGFLNKDIIISDPEQLISIDDYINHNIISTMQEYNIKETTCNRFVDEVIHYLSSINLNFSLIMNLQFDFLDFKYIYDKYPDLREIMECHFDESLQPNENEAILSTYQEKLVTTLKNDPESRIGTILRCKTGIKEKQLTEFTIAQSYKPTIDGKIIKIPIENSTLIRGLDRPSYLFIDANGSRKSVVMNKTVMGNAGFFGKLVLELLKTLELSNYVSDCNTKHLLKFEVKNKKLLQKVNYRYYKLSRDEDEPLKMVNYKKDTDLVGKTIYMRSPVTCALGNCVCARCFGKTATINFTIASGLPAFESEEITKTVNQNILSAKHLLATNSEIIEFNNEFYSFFILSTGEIYPNVDKNDEIHNIEDYSLFVPLNSILKENDFDNDSEFNNYVEDGKFYVVNTKTKEMTTIQIKNTDKQIFITDEARELLTKGKGYISYKDLNDDFMLFRMDINNNELTKPLYELMRMLNSKVTFDENLNYRYRYEEMAQDLVDILVESSIKASAVAAECIVNRLIRSVDRPYERPDFTKYDLEDYDIYSVPKALEHNGSPLLGISVQQIRRQLLRPNLSERTDSSYVDVFFNEKVSNLYDMYYERYKNLNQLYKIGGSCEKEQDESPKKEDS